MHPVRKIKGEHAIIKNLLKEIESSIKTNINRESLTNLLRKFESFWAQHEEREDKYFNWLSSYGEGFPYHKTIISQHKELRGHWKIIKNYLKDKNDLELRIALETDGKMLIE